MQDQGESAGELLLEEGRAHHRHSPRQRPRWRRRCARERQRRDSHRAARDQPSSSSAAAAAQASSSRCSAPAAASTSPHGSIRQQGQVRVHHLSQSKRQRLSHRQHFAHQGMLTTTKNKNKNIETKTVIIKMVCIILELGAERSGRLRVFGSERS